MKKYLYGIVKDPAISLDVLGMDDAGITAVGHNGLIVLLSETETGVYEQTRHHMMTHTRVLESALAQTPVLPIRFNTVAPNETIIKEQLLTQRRDEILDLFAKVKGRIELGIKAYWYKDGLYADVVASNPPIQQLRDSLIGKSENESYYERIELGQMIEQAIESKRNHDKEQILQALRPLALKTKTSHIGGERLVVNVSFLIDCTQERAFDTAVNQLDQSFGEKIKFKYIGPAPPYNFVNLSVQWHE